MNNKQQIEENDNDFGLIDMVFCPFEMVAIFLFFTCILLPLISINKFVDMIFDNKYRHEKNRLI